MDNSKWLDNVNEQIEEAWAELDSGDWDRLKKEDEEKKAEAMLCLAEKRIEVEDEFTTTHVCKLPKRHRGDHKCFFKKGTLDSCDFTWKRK